MGLCFYVQGIIPFDEKYKEMKQVWDTCSKAGVEIPGQVAKYFGDSYPEDGGCMVDINSGDMENDQNREVSYLELQVADIPPGVKTLRFVVSP